MVAAEGVADRGEGRADHVARRHAGSRTADSRDNAVRPWRQQLFICRLRTVAASILRELFVENFYSRDICSL